MMSRLPNALGRSLDTLFRAGALGSLSDGELLECLTSPHNSDAEAAFRAIVERHGPMVLGLCQSVIRDAHEAEDAFQATFLVLIRKAGSIRRRDTIGPWLYGVAGKVARKARARTTRRSRVEWPLSEELAARDDRPPEYCTNLSIVQEEVANLPERLRGPLMLCCLQGMSYDEAARSLGVSEPALRGRLHRARKRLGAQLRARGIPALTLSAAIKPSQLPLPTLSQAVVESTVRISMRWSSITALSTGALTVPGSIAILANGVTRMMMFQAYKTSAVGLLVGAGLLGTVVLAQQGTQRSDNRGPGGRAIAIGTSVQSDPQAEPPQTAKTKELAKNLAELAPVLELELKTRKIRERLKQVIEFDTDDLPVDRLLKHIKQSTTDATYHGIPIYVDPVGLQNVQASMASRVSIPKKGSVEYILSFALRECRLSYLVKDGFLMISSRDDITERKLNDLDEKMERVLRMLERLETTKK
jgi:RNA polymerase sigma factor (sigma-70 family)